MLPQVDFVGRVLPFSDAGLPFCEAEFEFGQPLNTGYRHFTGRAGEGKNFVFFDGHVEYLRRTTKLTVTNKSGGFYPYSYQNSRFWLGNSLP
ncbi:MAG TPA: hypothetical protein VIL86_07850 [Tepidisphaeraceae bacterium]